MNPRLSEWPVYGGVPMVVLAVAGLLVGQRAEVLYVGPGLTVAYVLGALVLSYTRCRTLVLPTRRDHEIES